MVGQPEFAGTAQKLAEVFDPQLPAAEDCLFPDPETGEKINVSHMIPHSAEDLQRRPRGSRGIGEHTVGVMSCTLDYVSVTFAGFAGCVHEWAEHGNEVGAQYLVEYQKFLRRRDFSLTYTLIHPTTDKSKGDSPHAGNYIPLHKVGETQHGIIVRGARILATLAPFADEIAVYPSLPLAEGADRFALSFCIPRATPA